MSRLKGKRAIVTGAASGIGRAVALRLATEGAAVGLLDRDEEGTRDTADRIGADGGRAVPRTVDVRDAAAVAAAVGAISDDLGGLDVLVCVAGIELTGIGDARVHALDHEAWQRTIDINLTGTFNVCKYVLARMLDTPREGSASVILTGSPCGLYGFAPDEHAYSASKAGVHGMMRSMASGYAPDGIRVNAVIPGYIETPLTAAFTADAAGAAAFCKTIPLGRPGTPEEMAHLFAWLASDDASYSTGGFFYADGGHCAI